jgi:DNA-binding beta-propeller fold protein YncE
LALIPASNCRNIVNIPPIDNSTPQSLAVNLTTNHIFIPGLRGNISVLDGKTNKFIGDPIRPGGKLLGVGVDPTRNLFYVTNVFSDTITVITDMP